MAEVKLRKVTKSFGDVEIDAAYRFDIVVAFHHLTQSYFSHRRQPFVAPAVRPAM